MDHGRENLQYCLYSTSIHSRGHLHRPKCTHRHSTGRRW